MDRISLLIALIVSFLASGCHAPPHVEQEHGKFLVSSPMRKDMALTKEYVAQIRAIQHIELRALERGYLRDIFVDEGQQIEAGQKMFQILPPLYQAEVSKAKAEADVARIELENTQMLADREVVSPSELALAKAKFEQARAQLSLAETHRRQTEIRAPFSGIMGRFHVRVGSLVDEGELLTTLSDNQTVWVYFNVSEKEYLEYQAQAASDREVAVKLSMANGEIFDQPGRIETIEADFNNETGNIAFRAAFANPKGLLRHGETGKVLMQVPFPNALLIPQKATFEILDKQFVYVVDDDGVVKSRPVSIAAEMPHQYIVRGGVEENDHILMEGLRKVRDGDKIAVEYSAPAEVFAKLDLPAE